MSAKRQILVAEDDPGVRDLIRAQLTSSGYDVHHAKDGIETLKQCAALSLDGLVLDINMPLLDGFGVLGALRAQSISRQPPVLILTARHAPQDVKRAIELGAKDYLAKPFDQAQLLSRVARLMRFSQPRPTPPDEIYLD